MLKNVKLSAKLYSGFGVVLVLLAAVMAVYQYSTKSMKSGYGGLISGEIAIRNHTAAVESLLLESRLDEESFLLHKDLKYHDKLKKQIATLIKELQDIISLSRNTGHPEIAEMATSIIEDANLYSKDFDEVVDAWRKKGFDRESGLQGELGNISHTLASTMEEHAIGDLNIAYLQTRRYEKDFFRTKSEDYAQKWDKAIETYSALLDASKCDENAKRIQQQAIAPYREAARKLRTTKNAGELTRNYEIVREKAHAIGNAINSVFVPRCEELALSIRRHEKNYLLRGDKQYVQMTYAACDDLLAAFKNAGVLQEHINAVEKDLTAYKAAFNALVKEDDIIAETNTTMQEAIDRIEPHTRGIHDLVANAAKIKMESMDATTNRLSMLAIAMGMATFVLGIMLAIIITRIITKPINRIINDLSEGAGQVASASQEISSTSQSLAEGASEQAASIEETSSSLEEMTSMTRQNAENSSRADTMMKEAIQAIEQANQAMQGLINSMEDITRSSDETSKIIRTIDEIAFQTNLLALNAAVEAARAGEAGAGFAVVADEVRTLAMRAASAAKETGVLIENTSKRVREGSEFVDKTNKAFSMVTQNVGKTVEVVSEITAASQEQSQGLQQLNKAVTEIDTVTQSNAANAEEAAAASEELSAQTETLKEIVKELATLIEGRADSHAAESHEGRGKRLPGPTKSKPAPLPEATHVPPKTSRHKATKDPQKVIPFDSDKNFEDF